MSIDKPLIRVLLKEMSTCKSEQNLFSQQTERMQKQRSRLKIR
uniref:Uncharacterized protein n=1 Tax=Arundo donax TaxID=35708 RepID=A0A0A9APL5_ARUDO